MEETKNDSLYQKELFDRLKKSIGLKKEEECIGCMIQPAAWWIIEKPNPRLADLKKVVACSCPHYKRTSRSNQEARAGLGHIQTGEKVYYAEKEFYTTNLGDLDITLTQKFWAFNISTPTSTEYLATATRSGGTHSGETIAMDQAGNVSGNWTFIQ